MRIRIPLLGLGIAALAVTPAFAADRTGTVSPTSPTYAWDGGPGSSVGANLPGVGGASVGNFVGCFDGIADCEETLIKVEAAGKLTVLANSDDDSTDAIDLYLWESDAAGEFDDSGADLAEGGGATEASDEKIEIQVQPGHYVAQVKFFLADNVTYKGTATLSGFAVPPAAAAPPPPPPPSQPAQQPQQQQPQSQPAPQQSKKKSSAKKRRAACTKKAKKIKNKRKRAKALKRCKKIR